jgi:hypothetical protein
MTQIWPGFGDAPVPTLLSVICSPDGVVMVFPAVWADTLVGMARGMEIAAAMAANTVLTTVRLVDRILEGSFLAKADRV